MTENELDHIVWLTAWYAAQCDGDWEHSYGVSIETLDNPGWSVKIDLQDTDQEDKSFDTVAVNMEASDSDPAERWHHCKVVENRFEAASSVHDLLTVIGVFRAWIAEKAI